MRRAQEERIKVFAGYLNTIAAGTIVTGIVAASAALILTRSFTLRPSRFGMLTDASLEILALIVMPGLTIAMAAAGYLIVRGTSRQAILRHYAAFKLREW